VGFRVEPGDTERAEQLLRCLRTDPDGEPMFAPVGVLDRRAWRPNVEGTGIRYDEMAGILTWIRERVDDYRGECLLSAHGLEAGEEEEAPPPDPDEEQPPLFAPDELFWVVNRVIPGTDVYLAHEEGSSVMDDFYRYEAVLNARTGTRTEMDYFRCVSEGVCAKAGRGRKKDARKITGKIAEKPPEDRILGMLAEKAEELGYAELGDLISALRQISV